MSENERIKAFGHLHTARESLSEAARLLKQVYEDGVLRLSNPQLDELETLLQDIRSNTIGAEQQYTRFNAISNPAEE